jgi:hypothetical protein
MKQHEKSSVQPVDRDPNTRFHRLHDVPAVYPFSLPFLRKAVFLKRIPFHKVGRCVYFKESDLLDLLESGRVEPGGSR